MTTGLFLAQSGKNSYRDLTSLAALVEMISKHTNGDQSISPLGNSGTSHPMCKHIQNACNEAVEENKSEMLSSINTLTDECPRIFISADMGTATMDGHRQSVTLTFINKKAQHEEYVVSVAECRGGDAETALNHVKKELQKVCRTKNVVAGSTDGARAYTGCNEGMFQKLKKDPEFDPRVQFIDDFCHKCERLMVHSKDTLKTKWVPCTINTSTSIVSSLKNCSALTNHILGTEKHVDDAPYIAMLRLIETRFSQFSVGHFNSILVNFPTLVEAIPKILAQDDLNPIVKVKLEGTLKQLLDIDFLCRVYLLDKVFSVVAIAEKSAQSKDFSPFDLQKVIKDLKSNIKALENDPLDEISDLIENSAYKYKVTINRTEYNVTTDLTKIEGLRETRSTSKPDFSKIREDFRFWIKEILSQFDDFLKMPEIPLKGCNIFEDSNASVQERFKNFKEFVPKVNLNWKKCSKTCSGIECQCAVKEFDSFMKHYLEKRKKDNPSKKIKATLLYYLHEKNLEEVKKLDITNICRTIEIFVLLKATQASCERAISSLNIVVDGRFAHNYMKNTDVDMVNVSTLLKCNGDYRDKDVSILAATKYTDKGKHKHALLNDCHKIGKATQNVLNRDPNKKKKSRKVAQPVEILCLDKEDKAKLKESRIEEIDEIGLHENKVETINEDDPDEITYDDPDEITFSENEIYCLCERNCFSYDPKSDFSLYGCDKSKSKCRSHKRIKEKYGKEGGVWFHRKCLAEKGITISEEDITNKVKWYCPDCLEDKIPKIKDDKIRKIKDDKIPKIKDDKESKKHKIYSVEKNRVKPIPKKSTPQNIKLETNSKKPRTPDYFLWNQSNEVWLETALKKEGMKLKTNFGDGYCLYKSLAQLRNVRGNGHTWQSVRKEIYDKMQEIFENDNYDEMWNTGKFPDPKWRKKNYNAEVDFIYTATNFFWKILIRHLLIIKIMKI